VGPQRKQSLVPTTRSSSCKVSSLVVAYVQEDNNALLTATHYVVSHGLRPSCSVSDVAWHPNDGLYLVTACDDDSRPVLRVWDLRSSTTTPLCELIGHTKGILSVDWCPHDPNLLVSCGKDSHTFVWDIQQGRAIAEVGTCVRQRCFVLCTLLTSQPVAAA
jgi:WD40 repeat protein